jgi:hypothetical protein
MPLARNIIAGMMVSSINLGLARRQQAAQPRRNAFVFGKAEPYHTGQRQSRKTNGLTE